MMQLNQIRETIEQCPNIWYTSTSRIVQCLNGQREAFTIESKTFADYQKKIAKRTVTTTQLGGRFVLETVFKDYEIKTKGSAEDASETLQSEMSTEDYDALFAANGALRPILFDNLIQNNLDNAVPNSLCFKYTPNLLCSAEDTDKQDVCSNVVLTLCSGDVMKANSLVAVQSENDMLMSVDTELIVHLYDGDIDFL